MSCYRVKILNEAEVETNVLPRLCAKYAWDRARDIQRWELIKENRMLRVYGTRSNLFFSKCYCPATMDFFIECYVNFDDELKVFVCCSACPHRCGYDIALANEAKRIGQKC